MTHRQFHYVVLYDEDSNSWGLDDECASIMFSDGTVWNHSTQEWRHVYSGSEKDLERTIAQNLRDHFPSP